MFRTFPLSIIRSFSLYTQQWYMSYRFADSLLSSKPVWHIPLLCVRWKIPDDGQRNCMKYKEFYSKNKFEKLVHLVGFIIIIAYFMLFGLWFVCVIKRKVLLFRHSASLSLCVCVLAYEGWILKPEIPPSIFL